MLPGGRSLLTEKLGQLREFLGKPEVRLEFRLPCLKSSSLVRPEGGDSWDKGPSLLLFLFLLQTIYLEFPGQMVWLLMFLHQFELVTSSSFCLTYCHPIYMS